MAGFCWVGWRQVTAELYEQKGCLFQTGSRFRKHRYNIEFVSANPTGPFAPRQRPDVIGDVLGNILLWDVKLVPIWMVPQVRELKTNALVKEPPTASKRLAFVSTSKLKALGEYFIELAQKPLLNMANFSGKSRLLFC